ncbi:Bacterial transcription activator, effector binding domain [compost metagenome]
MDLLKIPAQNYAQFTTTKGPMPQIVIETWQNIWMQEDHSKLKRQYTYDFEVYDQRSADPRSAEVEIYIGLKPS